MIMSLFFEPVNAQAIALGRAQTLAGSRSQKGHEKLVKPGQNSGEIDYG
jgi:hypothetical protein